MVYDIYIKSVLNSFKEKEFGIHHYKLYPVEQNSLLLRYVLKTS